MKRVLESGYVVAGGGAVEAALSIYLDDFAKSLGTREQVTTTRVDVVVLYMIASMLYSFFGFIYRH